MPAAPTLDDRRTRATFDLFKELKCVRSSGARAGELKITDIGRLDEEKMMAHILDCVAALGEKQRVRVALKEPLKLREDADSLTAEQQAVRNKVFRAALSITAKDMTYDGEERAVPNFLVEALRCAFPDSSKLVDGRGWLPMHWAVVADEDEEFGVTEADVLRVHETDPMALRRHHLKSVADAKASIWELGYTPAHLLCGLEMTEKNMSLVCHFSVSDSRAFTMKAVDMATAEHSLSALHVACGSRRRTEALLRLLVQLDPSQMKAATRFCGPLGLLCQFSFSKSLDERQFGCLVEADSSAEVVYDGIRGCCGAPWTFKNRIQTVVRLLEINSAAVQHKGKRDCNLAHQACIYSRQTAAAECIEVLKLVLARHKDALKEAADDGKLPAHHAAECGRVELLDFVLGEHSAAAAVVDNDASNLLHLAVNCGPEEHRVAKARLLCTRYPAMMLQRNSMGCTPLLLSCAKKEGAMARLLCEAGGREAASAAVAHPANPQYSYNGQLPLHFLIDDNAAVLTAGPLSEAADAFRSLLRLYPEAAGIEGGNGVWKKTPYQLAVIKGLPVYYRRLLLRAAPQLDPAGLRRLNWAERRMAMFVAFAAVAKQATAPPLLTRLRVTDKQLVKHVVSFL